MKHYLKVYIALLRMSMANLMTFRSNFFSSVFSSLLWGAFSFIMIIFLTARTPVIFGWKREELIMLMALYNIVIGGFFQAVFSKNFDKLANLVFFGRLDSFLLKPLDSQFLLSFWEFRFTQLPRILLGIAAAVCIAIVYHMHITLSGIVVFIGLAIVGIILMYSIWFLVLTLTIWHPRLSNLVHLLYGMSDFTRFPPEMYKSLKNYGLLILPYTIILVTPAKAIFQKLQLYDIFLLMIFTFIFFYLSRKFWRFALRSYTSASS